MFKLFFSPSGRINKKTFILSSLSITLLQVLLSYATDENSLIYLLFILPAAYASIILCIKRFHDLNKSGWNYLFLVIPLVNIYFLYLLYFKKGTPGDNPYGPDPLAVQQKKESIESHQPTPTNKDIISNSANDNPVSSFPASTGFRKKLILGAGVLLVAGVIVSYVKDFDFSNQDFQKQLSKQFSDPKRSPSSSTTINKEGIVNTSPAQFIFQVLNINNDEVTVEFERDIPMNTKFFGVSKDLARKAEILSRESQRRAVIYLKSASLLKIGSRYYGYLNASEEAASASEDWL